MGHINVIQFIELKSWKVRTVRETKIGAVYDLSELHYIKVCVRVCVCVCVCECMCV